MKPIKSKYFKWSFCIRVQAAFSSLCVLHLLFFLICPEFQLKLCEYDDDDDDVAYLNQSAPCKIYAPSTFQFSFGMCLHPLKNQNFHFSILDTEPLCAVFCCCSIFQRFHYHVLPVITNVAHIRVLGQSTKHQKNNTSSSFAPHLPSTSASTLSLLPLSHSMYTPYLHPIRQEF